MTEYVPWTLLLTVIVILCLRKKGRQWPLCGLCILLGSILPPGLDRLAQSINQSLEAATNQAFQAVVDGWNQIGQ